MRPVLLPASAAAFAPRSSPNVVLNRRVEPWLTATLKRVNRVKRPLNNVTQHTRCLTEILSSPGAIWTLCSLMLPNAPDAELKRHENSLVEALSNHQMIHVETYVVHVDMVSQNEVAFKLTPETIEALVEFHQDIYSVNTAASTWNWTEKQSQLRRLQEEFVQAANRFVYRTDAPVLEGLEEDGAGELLSGRSDDAKAAIMTLFVPLLPPPPPPPPRVVDVLRPAASLLPSSSFPEAWWPGLAQPPAPIDPWKVLPSSPQSASPGNPYPNAWASNGFEQSPSPTPSYSQICPTATASPYSAPQIYNSPTTSPSLNLLSLPNMLIQPCGTVANMAGFPWSDRYQDIALPGMIM